MFSGVIENINKLNTEDANCKLQHGNCSSTSSHYTCHLLCIHAIFDYRDTNLYHLPQQTKNISLNTPSATSGPSSGLMAENSLLLGGSNTV